MDTVRTLLASTPPAARSLWATTTEDTAILALRKHGRLVLPRVDHHGRTDTALPDIHLGAVRLLDRGIIRLATNPHTGQPQVTDTHAEWVWNEHHGEAMGLRLQRWRTLSFLPYQFGYYGLTPATMTGPQMVAVLVWHHAHTGVGRLDLTHTPALPRNPHHADNDDTSDADDGWTVSVVEHHRDGTHTTRTITDETATQPVTVTRYNFDADDADDFSLALRHDPPSHRQPDPHHQLHPAHEARLLHALCTRIAPTLTNSTTTALSVDLNTWLLHPHGAAPTINNHTVPLDVQDALHLLGAPPNVTDHHPTAIDWIDNHAQFTLGCKDPEAPNQWRHRHTLTLTTSGTVYTLTPATPAVRHRFTADHTLSALRGTTPTCHPIEQLLNGSDPTPIRKFLTTHRIGSPVTADRIEATHRITRWLRAPHVWHLPEHRR